MAHPAVSSRPPAAAIIRKERLMCEDLMEIRRL